MIKATLVIEALDCAAEELEACLSDIKSKLPKGTMLAVKTFNLEHPAIWRVFDMPLDSIGLTQRAQRALAGAARDSGCEDCVYVGDVLRYVRSHRKAYRGAYGKVSAKKTDAIFNSYSIGFGMDMQGWTRPPRGDS